MDSPSLSRVKHTEGRGEASDVSISRLRCGHQYFVAFFVVLLVVQRPVQYASVCVSRGCAQPCPEASALRIQWGNPWGFESLSHEIANVFDAA